MSDLTYKDNQIYMEGIIVEISDGSVEIEFNGRLGCMKIPRRMLITDYVINLGMKVGFMMSFPEVKSVESTSDYRKINIGGAINEL